MTARRSKGDGSVFEDKARGCWTGVIDLSTGPGGKRVRRKVSGKSKTECLAKLAALRAEKEKSGTVASGSLTVRQIMTELLANPPATWKSDISMAVNRSHARRITGALGPVKVTALTPAMVEVKLLQPMAAR